MFLISGVLFCPPGKVKEFFTVYNYNLDLTHVKFLEIVQCLKLRLDLLQKSLRYGISDGILCKTLL